ncbi:Bug family tripartite tricarboxylate transporter substrate binding protein [Variovorax atrisoli]|uniref:Bug family tripartite tricarboxylate transporter substrate binding protein n=1 Tax=Variovorax atrisoli TaxID=3394203 RepID=UPI0010467511|nr:tripartite tricarboxylate transporter substrate binding protein [Variovorax paradoxus]MDR6520835.1 tripartite-type tricarboxylate transporter receptor subunit TctC [Variovorax paradoxus]
MIKTTEVSARSAHRAVQAVTDVPALLRCAAMVLAALLVGTLAHAGYPEKPVRIVVPFAAGAGADVASRFMAGKLAQRWGQGTVVDNQVGANSIIGAQQVARAPADGYTLLVPNDTTLAANPALYAKLPYDPLKDFAPIALIGETPFVLVASPRLQVRSVEELVNAARARPGEINFSTSGVGSAQHLPMEILMSSAGIRMLHVPYKGAAEAATAVVGDQVQVMFAGVSAVLPFLQSGRLVPLAVGTSRRLAVLPQVPTMSESGFPGFRYGAWLGFVAPAATPVAIVNKINTDIGEMLRQPEVREKLLAMGFLPAEPAGPEAFRKHIDEELARYGKFIRAAGIEPSR